MLESPDGQNSTHSTHLVTSTQLEQLYPVSLTWVFLGSSFVPIVTHFLVARAMRSSASLTCFSAATHLLDQW